MEPMPSVEQFQLWARRCRHVNNQEQCLEVSPWLLQNKAPSVLIKICSHQREEQHSVEGRCHTILSWKVIHVIFLSIETDLVQAQERSVLLTQSSSFLIVGTQAPRKVDVSIRSTLVGGTH